MLALTTAVVVFTLVVQGLSLAGVVARSGLAVAPERSVAEEMHTRRLLTQAALAHLDQLTELPEGTRRAAERLRIDLEAKLEAAEQDTTDDNGAGSAQAYRELKRQVIARKSTELERLYLDHQVSDTLRRRLQHDLDLGDAALLDR